MQKHAHIRPHMTVRSPVYLHAPASPPKYQPGQERAADPAGGGRGWQDFGPPSSVVEAGVFQHPCEGEAVLKLTNAKIPYFNAPIYLENITQVIAPPCVCRE